jgi:uncharacterized protein (DUF3820 family)
MSSSATEFDPKILIELVSTKIYFGKYKGRLICDIPVYYLEWLDNNGMPKGKTGMLLSTMLVIKSNGLDHILNPLKKR